MQYRKTHNIWFGFLLQKLYMHKSFFFVPFAVDCKNLLILYFIGYIVHVHCVTRFMLSVLYVLVFQAINQCVYDAFVFSVFAVDFADAAVAVYVVFFSFN